MEREDEDVRRVREVEEEVGLFVGLLNVLFGEDSLQYDLVRRKGRADLGKLRLDGVG